MKAKLLERKRVQRNELVTLPKRFEPRFWEDADQRHHKVRTIRKRYLLLKEHCGADSAQKEMLCQRAAFISMVLETMEVLLAEGKDGFELGSYVQGTNALSGLLKSLGLERHVKQVGGLRAYLEERKGQ